MDEVSSQHSPMPLVILPLVTASLPLGLTGGHQIFLDTLLRTDGQSQPWCSWQLFYQFIERSQGDLFGFPGQMGVHGGCLG